MDEKLIGYLIVGIVLGGVFLFNFVLFQRIRKGDPLYDPKKFEMYGKFINSVKSPFLGADKDIETLSEIVNTMDQKDQGENNSD